jgi:hypothetical protein
MLQQTWLLAICQSLKALDGLGAAGTGQLTLSGYNFMLKIGWVQNVTFQGTTQFINGRFILPECNITATQSSVVEPFIESAVSQAAKTGTNLVYEGFDAAGTVRYVGITERQAAVRFAEHQAAKGTGRELLQYRVIDGATGLSRIDARIWEQTLINDYGLGKNGRLLLNKVNSIAPKYWWQYWINP